MNYPANKVHRRARRRLGRGQYPTPSPVTITVTGDGNTVTILFSTPVNVRGPVAIDVTTLTQISQTTINPTTIQLTMSGDTAGQPWTVPPTQPTISERNGAPINGATGTFAIPTATVTRYHTSGASYYDIQWSQPINGPTNNEVDPNVLTWSPGLQMWLPNQALSQQPGNTIRYGNIAPATDCTLLAIVAQPTAISWPGGLELASPTTPIPSTTPPAAAVNIIAATNNGDGTYTLQFSQPITNTNPGIPTPDPNILFFSPGLSAWVIAIANAAETIDTITLEATADPTDCTAIIILQTPTVITTTGTFEMPSPIITAT